MTGVQRIWWMLAVIWPPISSWVDHNKEMVI